MRLSRRECLQLGMVVGASLMSGCRLLPSPRGKQAQPYDHEPTIRWLNRVTFGATPAEVQRLQQAGSRAAYLHQQLYPREEEEPLLLRWRLRSFEIFQVKPAELGDLPPREVLRQLSQYIILRAVYSRHQLQERIVDFWRNHFNVYAHKGLCAYYLPQYEQEVLRPHAMGRFVELLKAVARSPAMLLYLDNAQNRRGVPNENYARELLELHTIGVKAGYTQKDVLETARCFTGWTVEQRFLRPRGTFRFEANWHDGEEKQVLSWRIVDSGLEGADRLLQRLALHPATAKRLCTKLCLHFVGNAPAALVKRLSQVYLETGGEIRAVLREMLLTADDTQATPIFKLPFDYLISALRVVGASTDGGPRLQQHLERMGQPLYGWPMPDGYPWGEAAWKNTMLARWNFALALCANAIGGTRVDWNALTAKGASSSALVEAMFCLPATSSALRSLCAQLQGTVEQQTALILMSPQFQWR